MQIFVDMDGVLCDFISAAQRVHRRPVSHEGVTWDFFKGWGLTSEQFWGELERKGEQFWSMLDPYPWFDDIVSVVKSFDDEFCLATSPSQDPECLSGKAKWCDMHLPDVGVGRRHMTGSKWHLAKRGRVLIDDHSINCSRWADHGGRAIMFPQPWNAASLAGREVAGWLRDELQAIADVERQSKRAAARTARKT